MHLGKNKYKYITGVQCPICNTKMWSRYTHDYRYCPCNYTTIDGGRQYLRYGWGLPFPPTMQETNEINMAEFYKISQEFNEYMGKPSIIRIRVLEAELDLYSHVDSKWPY